MGSGSDPTTFTKAASPWLAEQIYHPHHLYNSEPVSGATTWEKQVQKRETNINFSFCLIWLSDFYSPLLAIQFSFAVPQFLLFVRKALKIECCDLLFNVALYWRKKLEAMSEWWWWTILSSTFVTKLRIMRVAYLWCWAFLIFWGQRQKWTWKAFLCQKALSVKKNKTQTWWLNQLMPTTPSITPITIAPIPKRANSVGV